MRSLSVAFSTVAIGRFGRTPAQDAAAAGSHRRLRRRAGGRPRACPASRIAVLQAGRAPHVRGFGHDGRGKAITGDTPFPIGSLTKSFTALLVRQAIDAGQLDADAPVQRYLPWFRVGRCASRRQRITLRHLLNQTSGFSRADGIAPLLRRQPGQHRGARARLEQRVARTGRWASASSTAT
ncbi:MAG: beta-lactamase family protein [Comamonadaceae bacterium]|nr:beta-lactamase family protein [Comamonadaceae bacterium]